MKRLIIVGGGAVGFFLAANLNTDSWEVLILEKSDIPMRKLKNSGGGRCNLTHACFTIRDLLKFYPRGGKELKKIFSRFQPTDTINWFESRGVALQTEKDNRIFPKSNSAFSISDLLERKAHKNGVKTRYNESVEDIAREGEHFVVKTNKQTYSADALVVSTGSSPLMWEILQKAGHKIVSPVPSLFTFKCKSELIKNLQGISFAKAEISLPGTKLKESGALLITHQGLSGPSVLRLSAWGARYLHEKKYNFSLKVNWTGESFDNQRSVLMQAKEQHPKKHLFSLKISDLSIRFWKQALQELDIPDKLLGDLSKSDINRIVELLTNTNLTIQGKNVFKEEFVTAGGVDLSEIDFSSMQSRKIENLFLAGEMIDVDGVTGGFNFQACWSEAFVISEFLKKQ